MKILYLILLTLTLLKLLSNNNIYLMSPNIHGLITTVDQEKESNLDC